MHITILNNKNALVNKKVFISRKAKHSADNKYTGPLVVQFGLQF